MILTFEERTSDVPVVERVWRSRSTRGGPFVSIASSRFEIAVTRHAGRTLLTLRGPETSATVAECPADGEWLGIRFRLGTFMPRFLPGSLRDRHDVTPAAATSRSFWLDGSAWEYPDFENADTFVARLLRKGLLVTDPRVEMTLQGRGDSAQRRAAQLRAAQRHFLRGTGLSHRSVLQIDRARRAALLLREGTPIADVVDVCGYFDQAHLTRAVRVLIGLTPGTIARADRQLSFLYKTPAPVSGDDDGRRFTP